jgi:hypothetical protein
VRFLGKAADGSHGVDLLEAGPVLRGASVNSGTLAVRSNQSLSALDPKTHRRMLQLNVKILRAIRERRGRPVAPDDPVVRRILMALGRVEMARQLASARRAHVG